MIDKTIFEKIGAQRNVLTLDEAENRTNYWRQAIKPLYADGNIPLGFFMPFEDIKEMVDDYSGMNIAGIRVYFTLSNAQEIGKPLTNEIGGIMVPTMLSTEVTPEGGPIYTDVIIPVQGYLQDDDGLTFDAVTVYDVTQPCPPCCDKMSPLA